MYALSKCNEITENSPEILRLVSKQKQREFLFHDWCMENT